MLDNNLPPALASGFSGLFAPTHEVIHIRKKFDTGSLADEDWIVRLAAEGGWSVLSGDIRIAKKRPSRELFLRSNLVGFFPAPSLMKLPLHEKAARLLFHWENLVSVSNMTQRAIYEVPIRGKLRQIT